jgi:hypothetical protein
MDNSYCFFLNLLLLLTPFTVIEPFQWLVVLELRHIKSINQLPPVSLLQWFLFGPRDLVPYVRQGGLLVLLFLDSRCHQLSSFQDLFFYFNSGYCIGVVLIRPRLSNSIVSNTLVYFKFSVIESL